MQSASTNITTFPGKVGISNANPTHTLAIGSNVYVDDTGSNKLTVTGVISGDGLGVSNIQTTNVLGLTDNVTRITTLETDLGDNSSRISTVSTDLGDNSSRISTVSTDLGDNSSRISTVSTDLGDNSSRISTVSTDLGDNSSRISTVSTDLGDNSSRITDLSSNLSDNSSRITTLESGDISISGDKTFTGDVVFESNVHMNGGNVFVANTVNLTVSDPIIELGSNNLGTNDLGIIMTRPNNNSNVAVVFDESDDILRMGYTLNGANDSIVDLDSNALAVGVQGALSAASVSGDGSGLTDLNASNISTGALSTTSVTIDDYLIHDGDTDTKVGFPSADTFTVATSNSERLRVDSSGNVGIGTPTPDTKLNLSIGAITTSANIARFHSSYDGANNGYLTIEENNHTPNNNDWTGYGTRIQKMVDSTYQGYIEFNPEGGQYSTAFGMGGNEYMRIEYPDGNVGIGTASPSYKLNILTDTNYDGISLRDSTRELFKISKGNNGAYINMFESGASKVNISTNGDSYINGGNVGIGTTSPDCILETSDSVGIHKITRNVNNNNWGGSLEFALLNSSNAKKTYARIGGSIADSTAGSEDGFMSFQIMTAGALDTSYTQEKMRITSSGNVGIGIATPGATLDIRGATDDPSTPTVHIGDNVADTGDYGMVNLVRDATNGGSKSHLAFIRNGNTVVGMGFHNNTNTWGIFPSFNSVTTTPAMAIDSNGRVGIGTAGPGADLDVFNSSYNTGYREMAWFRVSNDANHTNWTRMIFGQASTNNCFIDITNQANTKGNLFLQPYSGSIGIGATSTPKQKLQITNGHIALLSTAWKTSSNDDQLAGKIDFHLGGDSGQQATPVAAIEAYDKWQGGSYYGALAFKIHGSEKIRIDEEGRLVMWNGLNTIQIYNQSINMSSGAWNPIGSFAGYTSGCYLITVRWGTSNNSTYWYGGASGVTRIVGGSATPLYNWAPEQEIHMSQWYHHRTVSQFEFILDSDNYATNYGRTTLWVKGYATTPLSFTTEITLLQALS